MDVLIALVTTRKLKVNVISFLQRKQRNGNTKKRRNRYLKKQLGMRELSSEKCEHHRQPWSLKTTSVAPYALRSRRSWHRLTAVNTSSASSAYKAGPR